MTPKIKFALALASVGSILALAGPGLRTAAQSDAVASQDQGGAAAHDEHRASAPKGGAASTGRKVLYYRNPMGAPDTSPVPKKDSMGMDYIPVYEDEAAQGAGGEFKISVEKVQRAGVRTAVVTRQPLMVSVRAPGVAKPDERSLRTVSLRADGFIEKLYANETGKHVKSGEPLFRLYSQAMVTAQVDYRTAVLSPGRGAREEVGAMQRLRNLDIPEHVLEALRAKPEPTMTIEWPSPATGVVIEKKVVEGQMARMGDELMRIADLTSIWVIADVSEQDIHMVRVGQAAKLRFHGLAGRIFEGRVAFILHALDSETRTAKVRIEVANPEELIRHEMYADVEIAAGSGDEPRLAVPTSAVIDSGKRQVVLVDKGQGTFAPRKVTLGMRSDDWIEVREGLAEGETVVVAANFLIDAESNLRAALKGFGAEASEGAQ